MRYQLPVQKQFIQFFSLLALLLFVSCSNVQNTQKGDNSNSATSSPNLGHLIYGVNDNSLSAFHSTTGTKAWQVNISHLPQNTLVTKDTIYLAGDTLSAFDAVTGRARWNMPLSSSSTVTSNIAVDGQGVYIASNNIVFAFHAKDGSLLWQTELQLPAASKGQSSEGGSALQPTIVIQNDIIYTNAGLSSFGGVGAFVAALQTNNGKQLWSTVMPEDTQSNSFGSYYQPIDNLALNNSILYGVTDSDIGAFNLQNGEPLWQTITGRVDSMMFAEDVIYITTYQIVVGSPPSGSYQLQLTHGKLSALNLPAGSVDFTNGYTQSTIYMSGGLTGGDMMAVHLPDGTTKWHNEGTGKITFVMVLANNIYTVRDDGLISLLNSHDGKTIWSLMLSKGEGTNMITDGNTIYLPGSNLIRAIDARTSKTLWSAQSGVYSLFSNNVPLVLIGKN